MSGSDITAIADLVFKALQIVTLLGGGIYVVFKLGRVTERVENMLATQTKELTALKEETKKVSEVLTQIALQKREIEILNERYEELRHGEGFVYPMRPVSGELP